MLAHINTNSNISFCDPYGCSILAFSSHRWVLKKWMSKNPNFKSNDNDDNGDEEDNDDEDNNDNNNEDNKDNKDNEDNENNKDNDDNNNDDDINNETLRRSYRVEKHRKHVTRIHLGGKNGIRYSEQSGDIWIRKEITPRCPWLLIP